MSNPTVSFRISDYHLARGLRAIRAIEPTWNLTTPAELIRTIFNDYIAKSEHYNKTPLDISPELLHEIAICRLSNTRQTNQLSMQLAPMPQLTKLKPRTQQDLEDEKLLAELRAESLAKFKTEKSQPKQPIPESQIEAQINATFKPRVKPSEFHDPNITESTISTVTDFSPPPEWLDKE